ncbi:hypothetical protein CRG98_025295 [Punica granatum]|uniref:Uncharacterized protein n=1 Tax=Punica granatum TaxID=22663 RepID=A0A2I0JDH3_PUNGR|nr:hypothetical protein CRG98_025295 [Punica granatum]
MGPDKKERVERGLCTVERPSDRDHLFTGESVGCEGPFERDGTTRRSHGKKWHVVEVRVRPMTVSGPDSFSGWNGGGVGLEPPALGDLAVAWGGWAVAWVRAVAVGLSRGLEAWLG